MTAIIFIVLLAVLVFVHELGHFIVAKLSGIRVDEFALGFPPRIFKWKKGETTYALNLVPFGGYVKIFGEDPSEESISGPDSKRSFVNKPKYIQAAVLAAGVSFNILFAWLLISFGFMYGLPASPLDYPHYQFQNAYVTITDVKADSPASRGGLKAGDKIISLASDAGAQSSLNVKSPEDVRAFIAKNGDNQVYINVLRGEQTMPVFVKPVKGLVGTTTAIGIGMDTIGVLKLPFFAAFAEGARRSAELVLQIVVSLAQFFGSAVIGHAALSEVTGPIGIASLVGDATRLGFIYLLTFTAFISLNLAVINLIPFPALDGGRILFVIIEAITRRPINPKIANMLNIIGFCLLIGLMLLITYNDITRLLFP